jgi:hypothetical protein
MEIDKKIILKLIQTLEELKKSIKGQNLNVSDETEEILEDVLSSDNVVVKSPNSWHCLFSTRTRS